MSCNVGGRVVNRRQIQLRSAGPARILPTARDMLRREGLPSFYRGFIPNCAKNLPNKGMPRFSPPPTPPTHLALSMRNADRAPYGLRSNVMSIFAVFLSRNPASRCRFYSRGFWLQFWQHYSMWYHYMVVVPIQFFLPHHFAALLSPCS